MKNNKLIIILATSVVVMLGYWFISKKADLSFLQKRVVHSKRDDYGYKVGVIVMEDNETNEPTVLEKIKNKFQNAKDRINNWLNSKSITENVKKVVQ